jgi:predicted nucleotidyltransferase component of viral defense system
MERFLARLSKSDHCDKFILKGGLMFAVWNSSYTRPTKDIDFLAYMANDVDTAADVVREICRIDDQTDGIEFDPETVAPVVIKEDADYGGVRVTFLGYLESARINMQIDMGFGDVVEPEPKLLTYPTILDHSAPQIRGYPAETVVAEKFQAMVQLGLLNSRIRDFYDIWSMSRQFEFNGNTLQRALENTFSHRDTEMEPNPIAFQEAFTEDSAKKSQWTGFYRKSKIESAPKNLSEMISEIAVFLTPVADAIIDLRAFDRKWKPGGPWE